MKNRNQKHFKYIAKITLFLHFYTFFLEQLLYDGSHASIWLLGKSQIQLATQRH